MAVLYILVVVGLWLAWREHRLRNCLLLLIVIFYLAIVSSGLEAYSRFRDPIMPFSHCSLAQVQWRSLGIPGMVG